MFISEVMPNEQMTLKRHKHCIQKSSLKWKNTFGQFVRGQNKLHGFGDAH